MTEGKRKSGRERKGNQVYSQPLRKAKDVYSFPPAMGDEGEVEALEERPYDQTKAAARCCISGVQMCPLSTGKEGGKSQHRVEARRQCVRRSAGNFGKEGGGNKNVKGRRKEKRNVRLWLHPRLNPLHLPLALQLLHKRLTPPNHKVHQLIVFPTQHQYLLPFPHALVPLGRVDALQERNERGWEVLGGNGDGTVRRWEVCGAVGEEGERGRGADDGDAEGNTGVCQT
jgi:hypothetical protein